jgi:hypothetical protein
MRVLWVPVGLLWGCVLADASSLHQALAMVEHSTIVIETLTFLAGQIDPQGNRKPGARTVDWPHTGT